MKGKKIRELLKKKRTAVGCIALAAALFIGAATVWQPVQEPEFPSFTDPVMEVSIEEEETPLASTPKVVTTTSKKKTTTKVKLKKAATKTYTKKLPTTTNTSTSTSTSGDTTVTKETKVVTATTEKYKKKKKVKTVVKTVTTTIKTTTVTVTAQASDSSESSVSSTSGTATEKYEVAVDKIAPLMDSRVLKAYDTLGFKVYVDPTVTTYSGYFNAKSQSITLRSEDTTIYHELGHFLAFIANNYDRGSSFSSVYSSEKSLYTGINKTYVTSSASEYFAESVRDYINDKEALEKSRPKTYAAVVAALDMITDTQVARIQRIYGSYWN